MTDAYPYILLRLHILQRFRDVTKTVEGGGRERLSVGQSVGRYTHGLQSAFCPPVAIQEVTAAQELCNSICSMWQCARVQKKALDERAEALELLRNRTVGEAETEAETETAIPGCQLSQPAESGTFQYRFLAPLEKRFPVRLDAIYGSRPAALRA